MFGIDPLKMVDEWSVLSDGSVAFVRGQDYHIDWICADGTTTSTPKLPFDWKRLTDEDKHRLVDSTRAAQAALLASDKFESEITMMIRGQSDGVAGAGEGRGTGKGGGRGEGGGGRGDEGGDLSQNGRGYLPPADVIPLDQIADYYPPIRVGATIPDLDGNLWILPTTSAQSKKGELIYDVVNAKGELSRRVRIPLGRLVAGFGKGGVVYLTSGDRATGFFLERTRLPK
jgi:hypothetical protein